MKTILTTLFTKWKWPVLIVLAFSSVSLKTAAQTYCSSALYDNSGNCLYGTAIDGFRMANLQHTGSGCSGYDAADYTSMICNVGQGESYVFSMTTLTTYTSGNYLGIWIDYNDNFTFDDAGEFVFASATGGEASGIMTIPLTAPTGSHRMRVRLVSYYQPLDATSSCTLYYLGETHDYTLQVGPPPACPSVSSCTFSAIGKFSATANWTGSGSFIVEYGLPGFLPGTGASAGAGSIVLSSASSAQMTGLLAGTGYEVYIRRDCGAGAYSQNLGPFAFITQYNACGTLQSISCATNVTASLTAGAGEWDYYPNMGQLTDGKEVIYSFVAPVSGHYVLNVTAATAPAAYLLKPASALCNRYGWTVIGNAYGAPVTMMLGELTGGVSYYLMMDVYANTPTTQEFSVSCGENFNPCAAVTPLTCGTVSTMTIAAGPGERQYYTCDVYSNAGAPGKEHIYSFSPATTGYTRINVTGGSGSVQWFYKDVALGCSGDDWSCAGIMYSYYGGTWSGDGFAVEAGHTYFVRADVPGFSGCSLEVSIDCPQSWDPCSNIVPVSCGNTVNAVVPPGFGAFLNPLCGWMPSMGRELIYSFTPSASGMHSIAIAGFPPYGYVFKIKEAGGGCQSGTWSCLSSSGYPPSFITPELNAGTAYYLMLEATEVSYGTAVDFTINCTVAPDPCLSVLPITCGNQVSYSIPDGPGKYATPGYNNYYSGEGREQLFVFTAAVSGTHLLECIATAGASVFYSIKEAGGGCNGSGWTFVSDLNYPHTVLIPVPLVAGTTYYLLADKFSASDVLTQSFRIICPDATTDPCTFIPDITGCGISTNAVLPAGLGRYSTCPSLNYYGINIGGPAGTEKVFRFTAATTGRYVLNSLGGTGMYSFAVKSESGGCASGTWECAGIAGGTFPNYPQELVMPFQLQAGQSYLIMVDAVDTIGASATFEMRCPEIYDPCAQITAINCGEQVSYVSPPGFGNLFLPACDYNGYPNGKASVFEFTAAEDGKPQFSMNYPVSQQVYIKSSQGGCSETGWQCVGGTSSSSFTMPYDLVQGQSYLLMLVPGYGTSSTTNPYFSLSCHADYKIYGDADADGFGDPTLLYYNSYNVPAGYSPNNDDCNDADASVNPSAAEVCGNGVDDDCDGFTDENGLVAGPVFGPAVQCVPLGAGTAVFSIDPVSGATGYTWSVPPGMNIAGGQGTPQLNVSWTNAAVHNGINGSIAVIPVNTCGAGTASSLQVSIHYTVPARPGSVSGPSKLCPGESAVYSVAPVNRASSYTWSVPAGMVITAGNGSNIISVDVQAGYAGGSIGVFASNACGNGAQRLKSIVIRYPSAPGPVSGQKNGLCNTSGMMYAVSPVVGVSTYSWNVGSGTIVNGQGTNQIIVNFGTFTSSGITVQAQNGCGNSALRSLNITGQPGLPGAIAGNYPSVCVNANLPYSVAAVAGALAYNWLVTPGGTISAGQGTKDVFIQWSGTPAGGQAISVTASNACGTSLTRSLGGISIVSCIRAAVSGTDASMEIYPNPAQEKAILVFQSDQPEHYELRMMDAAGRLVMTLQGLAGPGSNTVDLDCSTFDAGVYVLMLNKGGDLTSARLMLE
ncbi:MAG: T9SS type A sorting domain-containing protein [Bacteroidia bacterium]|nr:T9SS type A sorting domain-containing protein [Bacteroidia bacterium]